VLARLPATIAARYEPFALNGSMSTDAQ
jgi:hypothetical protein